MQYIHNYYFLYVAFRKFYETAALKRHVLYNQGLAQCAKLAAGQGYIEAAA